MTDGKLDILIVDDHDIVIRGIAAIVNETLGHRVRLIDTATKRSAALQFMTQKHYDICLLDIEMEGTDGIEMLKVIRSEHSDVKIIVNTIHDELWYVKEYLDAGVDGILFKSVNAGEIRAAIAKVADNGRYYCRRAQSMLKIIEGYNPPSPKEMEVLQLLAAGKSTKDIACLMGISINTVESHRRHLLTKLGSRNVAELIMNAVSEGLLSINGRD